ncbi:MAG: F0F1 ATP synthase subunit A [Endomicrobium sp.]|jgi:F-type H+-transporting ATPase subunit a|nr:F0F1 ATP synthase subunit A [Endomicrobium sp.]
MNIAPSAIFTIAGFPVTNTVITTLIADAVIISLAVALSRSVSLRPGKLQNAAEAVVDYFYGTIEDIAKERVSFIYPWVISFFIFIAVSNFIALFPGFGSIVLHSQEARHGHALFRAATSDLNLTLALAVISVIVSHYYSIKHTGIKSYLARFISLKMFPIMLFVGGLEFISELVKFISFSFRLFGNIFAGDIVLEKMYYLFPFLALETLVALIQALVFAMLTMAFMSILTEKSH